MAKRTRRNFLRDSTVLSAALVGAGLFTASRGYAKNETIQVGVIGCGGRARGKLMPALKEIPGTRIVAVCDVYDKHIKAGKFLAGNTDDIFTTRDHRELLARQDIDAVMIATPDHHHVPMTIDAVRAGKDVYVEKPLTHKIEEGQAILEAVRASDRIVQVGTQQRSMPQFQKARELIASGRLGAVRKLHMTWNRNSTPFNKRDFKLNPAEIDWDRFVGNASKREMDAYRWANWRWFWDYGNGILTDLMVHWLDAGVWLLDLKMPRRAMTMGDQFISAGVWETPDTIQTMLHYEGLEASFEGGFTNQYGRAGMTIMGENATLYLDRGRFELHPEAHRGGDYEEKIYGEGPRGADFFEQPPGETLHLGNWLECIRTRKTPSSPVEHAVYAAGAAHLGNQSYREGRIVEWKG